MQTYLRQSFTIAGMLAVLTAFAGPAQAAPHELTGGFNAIVLEDMGRANRHYQTDIEGRLAVGGNAYLAWYGIGSGLTAADAAEDDRSLVVGGKWKQYSGQIFQGSAYIGGSVNKGYTGIPNGTVNRGPVPVDFAAETARLTGLADDLAALHPTGSLIRHVPGWMSGASQCLNNPWSCATTLVGTGTSDVEVFSMDMADLYGAATFAITDVKPGATVIVNVFGQSNGSWKGGTPEYHGAFFDGQNYAYATANDPRNASKILYNFVDATEIKFENFQVNGSVLASKAMLDFQWGQINGALVVRSLRGSGEIHAGGMFDGWLPTTPIIGGNNDGNIAVPAPGAALLLAPALLWLARRRG